MSCSEKQKHLSCEAIDAIPGEEARHILNVRGENALAVFEPIYEISVIPTTKDHSDKGKEEETPILPGSYKDLDEIF